jgi:hypothetical protein
VRRALPSGPRRSRALSPHCCGGVIPGCGILRERRAAAASGCEPEGSGLASALSLMCECINQGSLCKTINQGSMYQAFPTILASVECSVEKLWQAIEIFSPLSNNTGDSTETQYIPTSFQRELYCIGYTQHWQQRFCGQ